MSGNNDISSFQATGKKCTVTGYGYMGESKSTLIFPRMLYFFARERITDNFADESIIDCIVLFWEWVNNNASSGCKNWEVRRMLSQRHVQCRVLWHVGGVLEIQETGGWDFQSPLCIISCWFLPVSCKSRKWRKSHNLDMGYFSFTTGYHCYWLTQTCSSIVDGTKWSLCRDLLVLPLTHLLLYH